MRKPDLDDEQRAVAARVTAMLDAENSGPAADPVEAVPAVHAISRDRIVLGDVLGDYLHRVVVGTQAETVAYWPALEVLRAAGADEERAAAKAAWLRHQHPPDET